MIDPAEEQRLEPDHAARLQESANFQLGGPEKLTGAHDPQHALADQWYMDDGDIMCHLILVLPFFCRTPTSRTPAESEHSGIH